MNYIRQTAPSLPKVDKLKLEMDPITFQCLAQTIA